MISINFLILQIDINFFNVFKILQSESVCGRMIQISIAIISETIFVLYSIQFWPKVFLNLEGFGRKNLRFCIWFVILIIFFTFFYIHK